MVGDGHYIVISNIPVRNDHHLWLHDSVGALHQHCEVTSSNPCWNPKFFRPLYVIAKIGFKTARIIASLDFVSPGIWLISWISLHSLSSLWLLFLPINEMSLFCSFDFWSPILRQCWRDLVWCIEKDGNDKDSFKQQLGSRNGIVLIELTSHLRGLGSGHKWAKLVVGSLLCSKMFFSGFTGFPLSAKINISKFQVNWMQDLLENHFRVRGASWVIISNY